MKEKGMGLDMYLTGRKYHFHDWQNPNNNQYEDGYRLQSRTFDLGYWHKHPDLHGFIVQNFAEGIDDCKPIYLTGESIEQILVAIKEDRLPPTTGFFFGLSTNDDDEKTEAIEILSKALLWLQADEGNRSIYYQASW
jgi:hypothetical protein